MSATILPRTVCEPARDTPIVHEADICVVGGSCTGLFAAVRAARLGARVAIIERHNCFGGVATAAGVNVWHSLFSLDQERQIIGGLTEEVLERLRQRGAARIIDKRGNYVFNSEELKIELDELLVEHKIKPFLHTLFVAPVISGGSIEAVIIENKNGRQAIKADYFIDASGDADLARGSGLPMRPRGAIQPPTSVAIIQGMATLGDFNWQEALNQHGGEFDLEDDWGWGIGVPGLDDISMRADVHVFGVDVADADQLTHGEIEGRRKIRAMLDIIRKYGPAEARVGLAGLPNVIGGRDSWHVASVRQLTGDDILMGRRFDDAVANGTYPVDIHHSDGPGITFRYLDGSERIIPRRNATPIVGRWREPTEENPTFYQIPFSALQQREIGNLALAGRLIDCDEVAFSAVRVMVNMNQCGEAAGVACVLASQNRGTIADVDVALLRKALAAGGSVII